MLKPSEWVTNYGDYLFSIALLKTNNKTVAEDLVQDTFLSAIKGAQAFKGESSEKTWLSKILNNKIIDYYRKKDVLRNTIDYLNETDTSFYASFFESDSSTPGHWKASANPTEWANSADHTLLNTEFATVLENCIHKMPPKLAPIFIAKYIDEDDSEKICKDFAISSSNYWVIVHRAKLIIRACLETNWFIK